MVSRSGEPWRAETVTRLICSVVSRRQADFATDPSTQRAPAVHQCVVPTIDVMRTTVDIDPRVLAAARARVNAGINRSLGDAVSDLALDTLTKQPPAAPTTNALVLLPSQSGRVITDEVVADALDD